MSTKLYPFNDKHLKQFEREIKEAGGFDELMIRKKALTDDEERAIAYYPDIDAYKEKYLIGAYEDLREHYETEAPYQFWGRMYEMLMGLGE